MESGKRIGSDTAEISLSLWDLLALLLESGSVIQGKIKEEGDHVD